MIEGLLPPKTKWCIAGGFAACPALASDIDLWVYGVRTHELQVRRAEILLHIAGSDFNVSTEGGDNVKSEEYEEEDFGISILKVGRIGIGRGNGNTPVHIMVTDAKTPLELLHHFDISTHAVAIDRYGSVIKHPKWTKVTATPVALREHSTTEDRLTKIIARYKPFDETESEIPF